MAEGRSNSAPRFARVLFDEGTIGGLSDEQLLGRFVGRRDEVAELAFAVLVERHGPMVLRACRAALRDKHDAQDAFQATFLVLARRASTLWVRDSLGPWLHGVAVRACAGLRAAEARRRRHERGAAEAATARSAGVAGDLASALDEEINRLPPLYRAPVILCHLEGRSHDQAAHLLGCPVGTVRSRLARGRQRLRDGLVRRGLAPADAGRAAEVPPRSALALPLALVEATSRGSVAFANGLAAAGAASATAITVAKGVIGAMWLSKMQGFVLAGIACGIMVVGVGTWVAHAGAPGETAGASSAGVRTRGADEAPAAGQAVAFRVGADPAFPVAADKEGSGRPADAPAQPPADWGGGGKGYALVRDETVKHGGQASGFIRSIPDKAEEFASFTQGFWANRYRGKRLRVTAYARSADVEDWAGLWMRIDGRDKGGLAFDNMKGREIRGTTEWQKYAVVLDVPDEAEDIFFGFLLSGNGRVWVDDIAFEVVGKDVASTDLKLPPLDNPQGVAPDLAKKPKNLDFER